MKDHRQSVEEIREIGYTIVPDLIVGERLQRAREESDRLLGTGPAARIGGGQVTGRFRKGIMGLTREFDDIYSHPAILAIVADVLAPDRKPSLVGAGIQLSSVMIKDVVPQEDVRALHQDDVTYPVARPRPPVMVNSLLALDDFCESNGGTLVVPGSHKWTCPVEQNRDCVCVEMPAGSIVLFDGALWHRNGRNTTTDRYRRALNIYYSCKWLRQMEGHYMGLSTDQVATLSPEMQRILS